MRALLVVLALVTVGCKPTITSHGVPNFVAVDCVDLQGRGVAPDAAGQCPTGARGIVYRSGQPTAEGWQYLRSLGITTVVKLNFESEGSDAGATAAGMRVLSLSIQPEGDKDLFDDVKNTFARPDATKIAAAERALAEAWDTRGAPGPLLVHCTHGQDRTGLVVGLHRIWHQGWTKGAAHDEMVARGFHTTLHGLQEYWEDDGVPPAPAPPAWSPSPLPIASSR